MNLCPDLELITRTDLNDLLTTHERWAREQGYREGRADLKVAIAVAVLVGVAVGFLLRVTTPLQFSNGF